MFSMEDVYNHQQTTTTLSIHFRNGHETSLTINNEDEAYFWERWESACLNDGTLIVTSVYGSKIFIRTSDVIAIE